MLSTDELTDPAVRAFITALCAQDMAALNDAVSDDFVATYYEVIEMGVDDLVNSTGALVVYDESEDGLTLTVGTYTEEVVNGDWVFTLEDGKVSRMAGTIGVEVPIEEGMAAAAELSGIANQRRSKQRAQEAAEATDKDGRKHPLGTVRRLDLAGISYVHAWGFGAAEGVDWINTGEKAPDPDLYKSISSPASGNQDSKGYQSKLSARLTVDVGWRDTYQTATMRFEATPYHRDSLFWMAERIRMVGNAIPHVDATLTLTAPDGTELINEKIAVWGKMPPYPLSYTRELPIPEDAPVGDYTLTMTDVTKTGGNWSDTIRVRPHTLTFRIGR